MSFHYGLVLLSVICRGKKSVALPWIGTVNHFLFSR